MGSAERNEQQDVQQRHDWLFGGSFEFEWEVGSERCGAMDRSLHD